MTEEPITESVSEDDNQPATQADLAIWGGRLQEQVSDLKTGQNGLKDDVSTLKSDVSTLKSDVSTLKSDVESLKRSSIAILNVVNTIDARLKSWEQIPAKVDRLHKRIFPR